MKEKIIAAAFLVFFLCVFSEASFVTFPSADLKAGKNEIKIGEPLDVTVEILLPNFMVLSQTEESIGLKGWDIQKLEFKKDITADGKYTLKMQITTFDRRINQIPKIRFSCFNKNDENVLNPEIFYFFSNSLPVDVKNVFLNEDFKNIRDIKPFKNMFFRVFYYVAGILYVLYVIFFIYREAVLFKISKYIRPYSFDAGQKAVRNLNRLYLEYVSGGRGLKEYYFSLSGILNRFIAEALDLNRELTTGELLNAIKNKNNIFSLYYDDIASMFYKLDNVKYTVNEPATNEEFLENFKNTRDLIEKTYIERSN